MVNRPPDGARVELPLATFVALDFECPSRTNLLRLAIVAEDPVQILKPRKVKFCVPAASYSGAFTVNLCVWRILART